MSLIAFALASPLLLQADETVQDFRRFYRREKDPTVRVELIHSLAGVQHPGVAEEMLEVLDDAEDPRLVKAALTVATGLEPAEVRRPLYVAVEEGSPSDALPLLLRAAADGGWREFRPLLAPYFEDRDEVVRLWAVHAAGALEHEGALEALCTLAVEDEHPLVRAAAVEAVTKLGKGHEEVAGPALVAAFGDDHVSVSAAACRGLRTVRTKEAIGPLIDFLENGEGRVLELVWPTLVEITDLPYDDDPGRWRKWWERAQDTYEIPTEEEIAERRAAREAANAQYRTPKAEANFMGVETSSRNVVFVIDVSGSMEELVTDRDAFRERGFTRFRKVDIVKEELKRSIEQLGNDVNFNVYAFATEVESWRRDLRPANTLNRRSAISWVEDLEPIGGAAAGARASSGLTTSSDLEKGRTNTYAALLSGLGVPVDPEKRGPVTETAGAELEDAGDTMFFLSDGRPTVGELVDTEDILQAVQEFNRFRKTVIHTIAIGDFTSTFLSELARQNGGVFVDLGR